MAVFVFDSPDDTWNITGVGQKPVTLVTRRMAWDAMRYDDTVNKGDWILVTDTEVVDIIPGRSGNAKFWSCRYSEYGNPYTYLV